MDHDNPTRIKSPTKRPTATTKTKTQANKKEVVFRRNSTAAQRRNQQRKVMPNSVLFYDLHTCRSQSKKRKAKKKKSLIENEREKKMCLKRKSKIIKTINNAATGPGFLFLSFPDFPKVSTNDNQHTFSYRHLKLPLKQQKRNFFLLKGKDFLRFQQPLPPHALLY